MARENMAREKRTLEERAHRVRLRALLKRAEAGGLHGLLAKTLAWLMQHEPSSDTGQLARMALCVAVGIALEGKARALDPWQDGDERIRLRMVTLERLKNRAPPRRLAMMSAA